MAASATSTPRPGTAAARASTASAASSIDKPRDDFVLSTKVGRILNAPADPRRFDDRLLGRRPALRAPLRLQLRRRDARLRGQPAAPRHEPHRHARHPRSRLLASPDRAAGRRPTWPSSPPAATGRSPNSRRAGLIGAIGAGINETRHDPALPRPGRARLLPAGADATRSASRRRSRARSRVRPRRASASSSAACSARASMPPARCPAPSTTTHDATPAELDKAGRIEGGLRAPRRAARRCRPAVPARTIRTSPR